MKNIIFLAAILAITACSKEDKKMKKEFVTKTVTEGNYTYEIVENDPMQSRIYTLKNGLKVYLTVYKDAPRIMSYIPVRAGSKNDPADATGLAHYLEHMLFKGTSKIGALDWEKEKPLLDKIEALYETYRQTTDPEKRKEIYKEIDRVSGEAATYAAANEYDKLVSNIGAKGTNAYTSFEQTVYVNDIPSNYLEKWLEIEAERFRELTPRLFHTELEAVYEEKNRTLDNDFRKVWTAALENLFPKHQYGTQTTIGTIEHLKNPSITEIKKYFNKYYIPNNIAICLSGDLDPAQTIQWVDKYFGAFETKPLEEFKVIEETPFNKNIEKEVWGPDAEMVLIGYRLPSSKHKDAAALKVLNDVLSNGQAGLIDVNLNQKQKVLDAYTMQWLLNDYSVHFVSANARENQQLSEVKDLLLSQIDSLKKGNFGEWIIQAAINNMKISEMKSMESNRGRANAFVSAFTSNLTWEEYLKEMDAIEKVTKEDIIRVANQYFNNYITVYKRNGQDPDKQQVEKPSITPVAVNRDKNSDFFDAVMAKEVPPVTPDFMDFSKIDQTIVSGYKFMHKKNEENELFDLYYLLDIGNNFNPKIGLAIDYLKLIGTDKYSLEELNKEFYKLGSKYYVFASNDQVYVRLTGLQDNFTTSLDLFEHLLNNAKPDAEALQKMIEGKMKERADMKLSKDIILRGGLMNYAVYGSKNPFNNVLSNEQLQQLKPEELIETVKQLMSFEHRVLYYGPSEKQDIIASLQEKHKVPATLTTIPAEEIFPQQDITEPMVYWVDYDMVQSEIMMISKSVQYNSDLIPVIELYNEYFGGGMGSIVFQEMRESKALAYSVWANYSAADRKSKFNTINAYIGTQADKLPEAMEGLTQLIDNLPESANAFETAKTSIKNKLASERITKAQQMFSFIRAERLGLSYDIRKDVYERVPKMGFEDIKNFQQQFVKTQPKHVIVIGSTDKLDFKTLGKYGKVTELNLEEVFGY